MLINFSKIKAPNTKLTKTFYKDEDGNIIKQSGGIITNAEVDNISIPFHEFSNFLDELNLHEAITLGVYVKETPAKIVTKAMSYLYPEAGSRSKEFFNWPDKGLILFDFDNTELPPEDGLVVVRELLDDNVPCYIRPSVSSGIIGLPEDKFNYHIYIPYEGDIPKEFRQYVKSKFVAQGLFNLKVSKIGSILVRTVADTAVISPERLVFEASPILKDGIERNTFKPFYDEGNGNYYQPKVEAFGYYQSEAQSKINKAKQLIYPEVKKIRDEYLKTESENISRSNNISLVQARKQVALKFRDYIYETDIVYTPEGEAVSALSIIHGSFIGKVLRDPIEPDYHNGAGVAMVMSPYTIHSFAHGSRIIKITISEKTFEQIVSSKNLDDHEVIELVKICYVSNLNLTKFAKILSSATGLTVSEAKKLFNQHNPFVQRSLDETCKVVGEDDYNIDKVLHLPQDASHYEISEAFAEQVLPKHSVFCEGRYYEYNQSKGVYVEIDHNVLLTKLLANFDNLVLLKRKADYDAVLKLTTNIKNRPTFFDEAAIGLASTDYFINVKADGGITTEPKTPEQRSRYLFNAKYTEDEPFEWLEFLHNQIGEGQTKLLQKLFGCILFQQLYRFQVAVLLYGVGASGKSTVLNVLTSLIDNELVESVSPFKFYDERQLYLLANKLLNVVPELPKDRIIPAEIFKTVVAGEPVVARKLYNDPVSVKIRCSHIFSGNHLIRSDDLSSGWSRRWLIIHFPRPVPIEERKKDFAAHLIDKEGDAIFSWAIRGYANIIKNNIQVLKPTEEHKQIESRQYQMNNTIEQFMNDDDYVTYNPKAQTYRKALYTHYIQFCNDIGAKPMSKLEFNDYINNEFNIITNDEGHKLIQGVKLVVI